MIKQSNRHVFKLNLNNLNTGINNEESSDHINNNNNKDNIFSKEDETSMSTFLKKINSLDFKIKEENNKENKASSNTKTDSRNTSDKKTLNKMNTESEYLDLDLDSLYFIDKVHMRSKSFKVPKLDLSITPTAIKTTQEINTIVNTEVTDFDLVESNDNNNYNDNILKKQYETTSSSSFSQIKKQILKNITKLNSIKSNTNNTNNCVEN